MEKNIGDKGGPQRCFAKSPHQPTPTVRAGADPSASDWAKMETKRLNSSCSQQDHENRIIDSHRIRTAKNGEKTRQDHIADRGHVSASHYNVVQKATRIPGAKAALDKEWKIQKLPADTPSNIR